MSKLLEVRDLVVTFGKTFSIGPMNLATDSGVIYLEGPNGGGKTSLLRAIAGEVRPSYGSVLVAGHEVHTSIEARRQLAFVPSTPELPEFLTVQEAYEFTASLRGMPNWDGAPYCQAMDLDPGLPLGYASAGQRRKAELICALAADPAILLFDETFAHLDQHGAEQLVTWVKDWSPSKIILLTHHGIPPVPVDQVLRVIPGQRVEV